MFVVNRFWTIVSIIAIFRPILINSLPQNAYDSEYNPNDSNVFITNPDPLESTLATLSRRFQPRTISIPISF